MIKRRFVETDLDKIVCLFEYVFKEQASVEWLIWKYIKSPWGGTGYIAQYDKDIVCFYGGIRQRFILDKKVLWAYQLCDVMTHPDYRGKLFSKTPIVTMLGEMLYDQNEMDFAFGFPSIRHARLQSLRLGGEGYRLITQFTKEISPSNSNTSGIKEGWQAITDNSLNSLLNECDKDSFRFYKDSDYILWRYYKHPLKRYDFLLFKGLFRAIGFVIYCIKDDYANVLELKALDMNDAEKILKKLETFLSRKNLLGIKVWCHQDSSYSAILLRLGYKITPHIPLAFKLVNKDCGITSDMFYQKFFYTMGDYDAS